MELVQSLVDGSSFLLFFTTNKGADVNARTNLGITALMMAAQAGNLEVVKYLVKTGANVNIADNKGKVALKYSKTSEIAEFLSNSMGK